MTNTAPPSSPSFSSQQRRPAHPVSVGKVLGRGIFVVDGVLYDALAGRAVKVMEMEAAPRLPGRTIGRMPRSPMARSSLMSPTSRRRRRHRQLSGPGPSHGRCRPFGKVAFINDSKATNADATARALAVYPDIFWIAGGKPKEGGIEPAPFSRASARPI